MATHTFLPVNQKEIQALGWEAPDFIYVTGDAYVDHPSFGPAIISRVLESNGFKVAMMPQPDFRNPESLRAMGTPRLGFLICGGNMDTMVNHYTVAKKKRDRDAYSPGGKMGLRPDRATIVYGKILRKYFPNTPIIIGGIEASLRRMAHYDYWSDTVMRSILIDSCADLLSYGMGERSIVEIAKALDEGKMVREITDIRGTVYKTKKLPENFSGIMLPHFTEITADKKTFAQSFYTQYQNTDPFYAQTLAEPYENCFIVQNPPSMPLSQSEMDRVYALPYVRRAHPMYEAAGGIPATEEIQFSITSSRGCFGACSFCALTFHQGRIIQSRSHESILREAERLTWEPDFKGYINDVGGPTANFRKPACKKQLTKGACKARQCLFPDVCPNMEVDHSDYLTLLRKLRALPRVKKVFIRSGIRFDYLLADKKHDSIIKEFCEHHISGQLKVAPEHIADPVLSLMGKPKKAVYERFLKSYADANRALGKNQFVVPYLMSSHPGSTLKEAISLAEYLRDIGYRPEQVQDFYPTPSTISTCMYYTGYDPRTMKKVYVPTTPHEKAMQRALIQYRNPKNKELVTEALRLAHREDLIGTGRHCLVQGKQYHRWNEKPKPRRR
ncbi:MAG: YgiQ family radical SAM protein [Clostridia bacterium]|nr:YgiQ family radical SAM protein [Clostridia bacterium]